MCGRTDWCGKATADADHQSNHEGEGIVAQLLGCLVHDGEEHGAGSGVGDKLGDERSDEADGRHHDDGVRAADVEDAEGHAFGDARLLYGRAQHDGTDKDHEDLPIDGFHGLIGVAAAEKQHRHGGEEGALQQREDVERRQHHHGYHDGAGDKRSPDDVRHLSRIKEMELRGEALGVEFDARRTLQQQRVAGLQHHLMRGLSDTLATAGYGHENHIVVVLKARVADGGADEAAAEGDVGCTQLVAGVHLAYREDGMVGIHEADPS